jgi:hypothetical protein
LILPQTSLKNFLCLLILGSFVQCFTKINTDLTHLLYLYLFDSMQKLEISLQKRGGKAIIYVGAAAVMSLFTLGIIGSMIHQFEWYFLVLFVLFAGGSAVVLNSLVQYFVYKNVKSVTESDGIMIKFYNTSDSGKVFNESEEFKLEEMGRFYVVKKRKRYLMTDLSFEFQPKSGLMSLLKEDVDVFPALWEGSEEDMKQIMAFVKSVAPEIELGYENLYQRLAK